ncbi:bifunctional adenosylcobinamide kinase/adenosylcobinamide-phosphate guanylyltransferase [Rubellimicrobium aerolatum]|uniref:Bifunctional adenosylcobalamin biosynthesis protein n=1 Tax=Rubellimicrobium aerolatum TaxID=490979 RepID=A0ABW0S8T8_9RHOB|nr:bifunctional adenosylcobinamide kinase/adenosylcobinamide-phosphate guanylyltransferase [Rubellimicrobium aerolatum]MBP1804709.1 adenosylcobinamide kinase/adenosylcobinamide-phosphate guanylyltransferase [Rubellimicrobium aerolatum]
MPLQKLTLVLGGAASGKSAFAEDLLAADTRAKAYIATAEAWDAEMQRKISLHRERRGPGWRTIEAPRDLTSALGGISPAETVLLDCATLWLTNAMLAEADLPSEEAALLAALAACPAPVVVVSNELGLGLVPETALGRRFREAQGRLNQRLAAQADLVVFVAAGLPLVLKGALP